MISTTNRWLGISFGRQQTRRWMVAAYWTCVAAFSYLILRRETTIGLDGMGVLLVLQLLVNLPGILGGVRSGGAVKPFRGMHWVPMTDRDDIVQLFNQPPASAGNLDPADGELDERETRLRDRVHFVSYTLSRWFAFLLLGVLVILSLVDAAWVTRIGPFFFFLLTLVLWSLPQSLIMWNEPDADDPRDSGSRLRAQTGTKGQGKGVGR